MPGSYHTVNALTRGLAILKSLARLGEATTAMLARETGIPRPTVHRLLETLRAAGYVHRKGLRETYRLTLLVGALAEAYVDDDWIVEVAGRMLDPLRNEVTWPTDIATYSHGFMVIRATTHANNPLSLQRVTSGLKVRMVGTATGSAYLAFCGERERRAILETLESVGDDGREHVSSSALERELEATRQRGYGVRVRGIVPQTSTIAVPVRNGARVLACININWIASAITVETAVQRYLAPLQATAKRMEQAYRRERRRRAK